MIKASHNLTYKPRLPLSYWLDKAKVIQPEPMTDKWAGQVSARQHNLSNALCQPYDRKNGARGSYTLLVTDIMIHLHKYTNNYKTLDHKCIYTRHSWFYFLNTHEWNYDRVLATWGRGDLERTPVIKTSAYLMAKWNWKSSIGSLHKNWGGTYSACHLYVTGEQLFFTESRSNSTELLYFSAWSWSNNELR